MSFWNSRKLKARKEHKCMYCRKGIAIGEMYWRETGTFENDFNDYCLDEICKNAVAKFHDSGDELGWLFDDLTEEGVLECPNCSSSRLKWDRVEPNTHKYHCECRNCCHEWDVEITEEMITGGAS